MCMALMSYLLLISLCIGVSFSLSPLLQTVVCNTLAEYAEAHGWQNFFNENLQSQITDKKGREWVKSNTVERTLPSLFPSSSSLDLVSRLEPEHTLPSRLLREELDGLLLLGRCADRSKPVLGESTAQEERGGTTAHTGKDRVLCVNQGWCEVFGFVDETAELKEHGQTEWTTTQNNQSDLARHSH